MPKGIRKQYTPEFKFKLVQEVLRNSNTTEVARKHGLNFNLLSNWKNHFLAYGKQVFETTTDKEKEELKKKRQKEDKEKRKNRKKKKT